MELCIHELEPEWCSFCLGKETDLGPASPPPAKRAGKKRRKAKIDPEIAIAEGVASGELCPSCLTPYKPMGCHHARRAEYVEAWAETQEWISTGVENNLLDPKRDGAAIAFMMQRRLGLRAPLLEGEHQADRADIMEALDLQPKWTQPVRRHPDHLPV